MLHRPQYNMCIEIHIVMRFDSVNANLLQVIQKKQEEAQSEGATAATATGAAALAC